MKYDIVYLSDAQNGKKWFKSKQIGLEKRFANEVKNAILLIGNDLQLFEVRYRYTRIVFTKISLLEFIIPLIKLKTKLSYLPYYILLKMLLIGRNTKTRKLQGFLFLSQHEQVARAIVGNL